jgi:hypothetical protein
MGNRSYTFEITWCWKQDGNRPDQIADIDIIHTTTVTRAISKLVRLINEQEGNEKGSPNFVKVSDLMIIDVRNHKITQNIINFKRDRAAEYNDDAVTDAS